MDELFRFWKRSIIQVLTRSDPKNRGKEPKTLSERAHNPLYEKRGWADQADSRPLLQGPDGWVGDWYLWHAPDSSGRERSLAAIGAPGRESAALRAAAELVFLAAIARTRCVTVGSGVLFG